MSSSRICQFYKSHTAPKAVHLDHQLEKHGVRWNDPLYWLRDKNSPEVISHIANENTYTSDAMQRVDKLCDELYAHLVARIAQEEDYNFELWDDYVYFLRTIAGKQHHQICRRRNSGNEEVLVDGNSLGEGCNYFKLTKWAVSDDHNLIAYLVDMEGGEKCRLNVKDIGSGKIIEISDAMVMDSMLVWSPNCKFLYYTTATDDLRPDKLWRHRIGTLFIEDRLLYHETDCAMFLRGFRSRCRRWLLLEAIGTDISETSILDLTDAEGALSVVEPRDKGHIYSARIHGDELIVRSNWNAPNFQVLRTPLLSPDRAHWRTIIRHDPEVLIEDIDCYHSFLAVFEKKMAAAQLAVYGFRNGEKKYVDLPSSIGTISTYENHAYDSENFRFTFSSYLLPDTQIEYDFNAHSSADVASRAAPNFSADDYLIDRVWVPSSDDISVPMDVMRRRDTILCRDTPCYLYGYGAYGYSIEPGFSLGFRHLDLLDRGFVVAIAHVRGGSELGRRWYDNGKLANKMNTFHDFIACAEFLIDRGMTSQEKLSIGGGSAGGLLVGAVLNLRPELFAAAVTRVPFVDLLNTMLDSSQPLTTVEYEEWGNPNNRTDFDRMRSYSPYDNIAALPYPAIFASAGLNDPRVYYWEPLKWVAKLREHSTGRNPILIRINTEAGHFGESGRYVQYRETAAQHAFLIDVLVGSY